MDYNLSGGAFRPSQALNTGVNSTQQPPYHQQPYPYSSSSSLVAGEAFPRTPQLTHLGAAAGFSDPCLVCGEPVAARHYGSVCCNGCKGFFHRSVAKAKHYTCSNAGHCRITRVYRNSCRACRMRKCLSVGLRTELVCDDRATARQNKQQEVQQPSVAGGEESQGAGWRSEGVPCRTNNETGRGWEAQFELPYSTTNNTLGAYATGSGSTAVDRTWTMGGSEYQARETDPSPTPRQSSELDLSSSSGKLVESNSSSLPLAAYSGLLQQAVQVGMPLGQYFVLVERLCKNYSELDSSIFDAIAEPLTGVHFNLNISPEQAFFQPRTICTRTRFDWSSRFFLTGARMAPSWCRMATFYSDWASHIPKLRSMDTSDVVALMSARATQCVWMWFVCESIKRGRDDEVVLGCGSVFHRDEGLARQALASGEDKSVLALLQSTCSLLFDGVLRKGVAMGLGEEELALLKVLCFCVPALSARAKGIVHEAQTRYQAALITAIEKRCVRASHSQQAQQTQQNQMASYVNGQDCVSTVMSWLSAIERVAQVASNHLSVMTLFNVAEMRGSLPYEIHVRNNS